MELSSKPFPRYSRSVSTTTRNTMDDASLADSRQCATMNHNGIMQLQESRFLQAIDSFGSALSLLNQVLSTSRFVERATRNEAEDEEEEVYENDQEEEDHGSDDDVILDDSCGDGKDTIYTEDNFAGEYHAHKTNGSDELLRHQNQLYKTPIPIPSHFLLLDVCPTYDVLVKMSISIMFNFALSHHLAATTAGLVVDPSKTMDQAVALYELTHTLQLQEGIELSIEHTMATICNLGHIHQSRGNTDKATKCFQHLLTIIVFLQSQNQHQLQEHFEQQNDAYDEENIDSGVSSSPSLRTLLNTDNIFFQSVSHLMLRHSDTAAAA